MCAVPGLVGLEKADNIPAESHICDTEYVSLGGTMRHEILRAHTAGWGKVIRKNDARAFACW